MGNGKKRRNDSLGGPSNKRQQPKGQAGNPAGQPAATCQQQQQKVTPPQPKPCDIDEVRLDCAHHFTPPPPKEKPAREFGPATWKFNSDRRGYIHNLPQPRRKGLDFRDDVYEVTTKSLGTPEVVELTVLRAECHHPAEHPIVTITEPPELGGKVRVEKGANLVKIQCAYPWNWWERVTGLKLSAFVFRGLGEPISHSLLVQSCGCRTGGKPAMGVWKLQLRVFPDDVFKFALAIPPKRKFEGARGEVREGRATISKRESKTVGDRGRSSHSHSTERTNTHDGNPLRGATTSEKTTVVAAGTAGAFQMERVDDAAPKYSEEGKEVLDSLRTQMLQGISLTRNGSDVTQKFSLLKLIGNMLRLKAAIEEVIDTIQKISSQAPQVGWKVTYSYEIFSGELTYEWAWKESKNDHRVYRWWKLWANFTLIAGKFEVSFGIAALKAKAEVFGNIGGDAKLSSGAQSSDDSTVKPGFSVAVTFTGELGARAALGDFFVMEGKVKAGITGKMDLEFNPFSFVAELEWMEGKASAKVAVAWGLYERESECSLWDKKSLGKYELV